MSYEQKYLKYKQKYLNLKGGFDLNELINSKEIINKYEISNKLTCYPSSLSGIEAICENNIAQLNNILFNYGSNRKTQYEDMGLEKLVGIYIKNILKLNFIYDIEYEIIRCDWFNLKIKNLESNTRCIDDDNNYNKNYQNLFKLKKEKNINLKKVKDILNKNNIKFNVTSDDNIYIKI